MKIPRWKNNLGCIGYPDIQPDNLAFFASGILPNTGYPVKKSYAGGSLQDARNFILLETRTVQLFNLIEENTGCF